ncbi:ribonuclease R [Corynebacterium diphtheriae]|nr:ribonuclease R [Corynebacterium diphtheriae bv. mitis]OSQ13760.1 ribonuclease R [Corynebacterium diphtheriae]PSA74791.1 ribonuclease R [Corynebacterium diphtheriae]RKW98713.1 ribonuclease R [Corynebacterium diphtheriae]
MIPLWQPWVGHNFPAVVIDSSEKNNTCRVFIENPPVTAACVGAVPRGKQVDVTVIEADPSTRSVRCAWPAD